MPINEMKNQDRIAFEEWATKEGLNTDIIQLRTCAPFAHSTTYVLFKIWEAALAYRDGQLSKGLETNG